MTYLSLLILLGCGFGACLTGAAVLCDKANRFMLQKRYKLAHWSDYGTYTLFTISAVFAVAFIVALFTKLP